ncbi:hypothetical protein IC757_00745 [Wenzhouxiangella sp. AB-CW3]|uniref:hypothetical protein n=1 Tax=Wenzhouxiangella sp. AB-CW3 TaxID=2771012 RepID=UPI00168A5A4E|nr:hypothetical protein [Wenzhouxiangella sp. AB-CW3]QOC22729.1 hypothetical protein IC757_00745 [Wenzhouxiangella sp. AB-CW3]
MSVDLAKAPHIVVVHGVQRGSGMNIELDETVCALVDRVLRQSHISEDYTVDQYVYEHKNDQHPTVRLAQFIARAISRGRPLAGRALSEAIDLAGDVVINARNSSTAGRIRAGLAERILSLHEQGHRVLLLGHSLGSVYALQTLNELMAQESLFAGDDRRLWAVQGLVTLGSPLGLDIEMPGMQVFPKVKIAPVPSNVERLPWHNFYSLHDPVVSGRVFGTRVEVDGSDGPVEARYRDATDQAGWLLHGHVVNSGVKWLLAHTAYWKDPTIGVRLVSMLWG